MSTDIKFKILAVFSFICLLGLAAQSYYLFDMNRRLGSAVVSNDSAEESIPESIQRRLEEQMAKPDRLFQDDAIFDSSPGADPFTRMNQMRSQMDRLFGALTADPFFANPGFASPAFGTGRTMNSFSATQPQINVLEQADAFVVTLSKQPEQDIEISTAVEDNVLSLSGTLRVENSSTGNGKHFSSSSISQFSRSIPFPQEVDPLGIYTSQESENIVITVPKMKS